MLAQRVRKRVGAPQKHAAVPEVVAGVEKLPGHAQIRFFGETADTQRAILVRRTGLDIAVTRFRASRADTEHNDVLSRCGDLDSPAESRAVLSRIGDDVIGGK